MANEAASQRGTPIAKTKALVKFHQQEQALKQRTAQRGIKIIRRKAGRMLLLALLLMQPAWAVQLCNCQTPVVEESAACHATQASPATTHHCAEAETSAVQETLKKPPQTAMRCCDLTTETETPATLDAPQYQGSVVVTAPFLPLDVSEVFGVAYFDHQSPPQTRPLYLAYSCLLI